MLYDPSHYVLQCLDYLDNIDIYKDRIKMFHVKDAEFNPTGRQGVYGGYQGWVERAGRFRSLGDGQVDFGAVFSKLTANNFDGWAVVEWECALKNSEDGAREGAEFVKAHIIEVTEKPSMISPPVERMRRQPADAGTVTEEIFMTIEASKSEHRNGKIRLGMVGGGQGAFIGAVHRMAARLDDHYDLVAGALSSTPEKSRHRDWLSALMQSAAMVHSRRWQRGKQRDRMASKPSPSSRPIMCILLPPKPFWNAEFT